MCQHGSADGVLTAALGRWSLELSGTTDRRAFPLLLQEGSWQETGVDCYQDLNNVGPEDAATALGFSRSCFWQQPCLRPSRAAWLLVTCSRTFHWKCGLRSTSPPGSAHLCFPPLLGVRRHTEQGSCKCEATFERMRAISLPISSKTLFSEPTPRPGWDWHRGNFARRKLFNSRQKLPVHFGFMQRKEVQQLDVNT